MWWKPLLSNAESSMFAWPPVARREDRVCTHFSGVAFLIPSFAAFFVLSKPHLTVNTPEFVQAFDGMTAMPVSIEALAVISEAMFHTMVGQMPEPRRRFLISFKYGEPDWPLLEVSHASELPAVRWRQFSDQSALCGLARWIATA